jgi:hypothetical protein
VYQHPRVLSEAFTRAARIPGKVSGRLSGGLKYHAGPVALNRAGFQVGRFVYMNLAWRLRSVPVDPEVDVWVERLIHDGCVLIPDFLPADVLQAVRREYDESFKRLAYEIPIVEDDQIVEETLDVNRYHADFPVVQAALVHNPTLRAIVSGALRRPVHMRPRAFSKRWHLSEKPRDVIGPGHIVGANYVHADVHFPTFKAWLFLSDTDRWNGALEFARGSHHMTAARLRYEYDASCRVAASRGKDKNVPYALTRKPTDSQLGSMKIQCSPLECKANTLVIGNMQGFHKRGEFQPGSLREALLLCFRNNEPRCPLTPGDIAWDADPAQGLAGPPTEYRM